MTSSSLIDVNDSVLIAIDIQPSFVKKENKAENNPLLQRMCWVIQVANWLNVPLIVTAEDIPNTGNICEEVAHLLPPNTKIYNKMTFGLAAQAEILEAIQNTNSKTAVLIGYETDVCHALCLGPAGFGISSRGGGRRNRVTGRSSSNRTESNPWRGRNHRQREEFVLRMDSHGGKVSCV